MELLVLNKLKWDLSSVTPLDFIDYFLSQLAVRRENRPILRKHAETFVALCATGMGLHYIHDCLFIEGGEISLGQCSH